MNLAIKLPPVLADQLKKYAADANLTLEEFLLLAGAEKIASMKHHQWLKGKDLAQTSIPCDKDEP